MRTIDPTPRVQHNLRWIGLLVAVLIAGMAGTDVGDASALTISSAQIKIDPTRSDGFKLRGTFTGVPFGGATAVIVDLGGVSASIPLGDFVTKRQKLEFKAPRDVLGITKLTFDLKKSKFSVQGVGFALAGLSSVVAVQLGTDLGLDCAMIRLENRTKPAKDPAKARTKKRTLSFSVKRGAAGPCGVVGTPSFEPARLVVGVATLVRVEGRVDAAAFVATSVALVRLDALGQAVGSPLCTLADDGSPGAGDVAAGDGVFACTTTVTEPNAGVVRLALRATSATAVAMSGTAEVVVGAPLSDAAIAELLAVHGKARTLWAAQRTALGDSLTARLETVRALRNEPGVADAFVSPNNRDITIRTTAGLIGGLMLSARFVGERAATVAAAAHRAAITVPAAGARRPGATVVASAAAVPSCTRDERIPTGNLSVFVWKTSYFPTKDDATVVRNEIDESCLALAAPQVGADVPALESLTQYGTIALSSHGILLQPGFPAILTDETWTPQNWPARKPRFERGQLAVITLPNDIAGGGRDVYAITPAFVRSLAGRFPDSIVYASACFSAATSAFADAFRQKGARVFLGFDRTVSQSWPEELAAELFTGLAAELRTAGDAEANVTARVDPYQPRPIKVKGVLFVEEPRARLVVFPEDARVAYVDDPAIEPATASVEPGDTATFTVAIDRTADCDLRYLWGSVQRFGTIADDEGHQGSPLETQSKTLKYTVDPNVIGGGRERFDVAVFPPEDRPGGPSFFAQQCAEAVVVGCGNGVKEDGEECDGGDGPCAGRCKGDCTCDSYCGDNHKDPGEICDGTDSLCPAGACKPDCTGCYSCGNGFKEPGEECDWAEDSACPGRCLYLEDCTCGCEPGNPASCPGTTCCDPETFHCCTPQGGGSAESCGLHTAGCCGGNGEDPLGGTGPGPCDDLISRDVPCPAPDCEEGYWACHPCDGKYIRGFCDLDGNCSLSPGPPP